MLHFAEIIVVPVCKCVHMCACVPEAESVLDALSQRYLPCVSEVGVLTGPEPNP